MPLGRVQLGIDRDQINGPFITAEAVNAVGWEHMLYLNKSGSIFWYGHSKQYYCAYQEIRKAHAKNAPWYYEVANPLDECSAQYGRIRIYQYERFVVAVDSFTRETYISHSLAEAFETAVMIAHYFPDERVVPDVDLGYKAVTPKITPTQIDASSIAAMGDVRVYDDGKSRLSLERAVSLTLGDAISIIMGDRPSSEFLSYLCDTFPEALVSAYGVPLIVYCKETTIVSVAQSLSSLAMIQGISVADAIASYVDSHKVGKYTVVGGWGYRILQEYGKDVNSVALVDLALAHSGSPEIARATIVRLTDQEPVAQPAC